MDRTTLPDVIDTERLRLRRWALDDAEAVYTYARDEEWSRYLRMLPAPYERRHADEFVARQLLLDPITHPAWAIVLDGSAIGGVNLRLDFNNLLADLGYSIARAHWNRGCMTEVARAVVDAAFSSHGDLGRVRGMADARNTASQRVMEKIGMKKEGVLRLNRVERGEAFHEVWYGILRSEWAG